MELHRLGQARPHLLCHQAPMPTNHGTSPQRPRADPASPPAPNLKGPAGLGCPWHLLLQPTPPRPTSVLECCPRQGGRQCPSAQASSTGALHRTCLSPGPTPLQLPPGASSGWGGGLQPRAGGGGSREYRQHPCLCSPDTAPSACCGTGTCGCSEELRAAT